MEPTSEIMFSDAVPSNVNAKSAPPKRGRSAVTNGSRLFAVVPGDRLWARRFRDLYAMIVADVASGQPPDVLTEGQRQLIRRAVSLCIACEQIECKAAAGAEVDWNVYGQMSDRLGRAFHRLGLKRQAIDVGAGLGRLLAHEQRGANP